MSRHLGHGTFEFSHEDLGPSTWPVRAGAADAPDDIPTEVNAPAGIPTPEPWTTTQLIDWLKTSALPSASHREAAVDMLLRLAEAADGQGDTKCESYCADALVGFVKMMHHEITTGPELVELCLKWLANDVGDVVRAFLKEPVRMQIELIHGLAARVAALSQTPMRTLLTAPGQSASGFSRTTEPLLHTIVTEEAGFAALLLESTEQGRLSSTTAAEYQKNFVTSPQAVSLHEECRLLQASLTETLAMLDKTRAFFYEYSADMEEILQQLLGAADGSGKGTVTKDQVKEIYKEYLVPNNTGSTVTMSPPRWHSNASDRSPDSEDSAGNGGVSLGGEPFSMVCAAIPTDQPERSGTKGTAATRGLIVRLGVLVGGWAASQRTADESMVSSLARQCFAEVTAMSADVAKQGPAGWLGIIDPRCPVVTQFDTLIVHYLNATRRASGNRPGYDKDFRRHASAYRQQLYFFKSVKRGPLKEKCVCNEEIGIICIYPGNASIYTGSPPCTPSPEGLQQARGE